MFETESIPHSCISPNRMSKSCEKKKDKLKENENCSINREYP